MNKQHKNEPLTKTEWDLSVVIPAFNASKSVLRTLSSLEEQTIDRSCYQIIVVDDGSTDDTLEYCKQFAAKYPNILVLHKENNGVSSARNAGIAAASGKWITFVDSDDYVDRFYVENVLHIDAGIHYTLFGHFEQTEGNSASAKKWMNSFLNCHVTRECVLEWICDNRINSPWDKRFSLDIIRENGLHFMEGIHMGEDLLFNFEYVLCADTFFLSDRTSYIYTENPDGLCHKKVDFRRLYEYETIYNEISERMMGQAMDSKYQRILNRSFLRVIARYAGQLVRSGILPHVIKKNMSESNMVCRILYEPAGSVKDWFRKILLYTHQYKLCALLLRK